MPPVFTFVEIGFSGLSALAIITGYLLSASFLCRKTCVFVRKEVLWVFASSFALLFW
ncbi:hypothetical protein CTI12_AA274040 [Artemisia annua]|uniref:Uncharacterized protein n=1 Tax=Artemisia annua TaxID=35608 RepID=A0A2U1NF04_ARTAN|nr:hypothetical protein CTI12_AA274040 [Artemisia annua]